MNQTQESVREQISALADGNLCGEEFARVVGAVAADAEMQASWRAYHVIGDVLRSGDHAPCTDSAAFMASFRQRMAAEVQAGATAVPAASVVLEAALDQQKVVAKPVKVVAAQAANEPVFRWKLVAGAASLAAAAAIGWNLVGIGAVPSGVQLAQQSQQQTQGAQQSQVQLAAGGSVAVGGAGAANSRLEATPVLIGNGDPQIMLRDARLDVLLEAHRQAGGASQMPSGFLRNATFDGPSR